MKELVVMCPFRKEAITDLENLAIQFTRQTDGWQFVCNVCPHTTCTGFILDTPQPSGKKGTRFLRA
ncbi:MAG: hypothetical protein GXO76_07945 [Calditrichaeota bacterium]|nr:hypothetical protein [Calditrichota bacterium]